MSEVPCSCASNVGLDVEPAGQPQRHPLPALNLLLAEILDWYGAGRCQQKTAEQEAWLAEHPGADEFDGPWFKWGYKEVGIQHTPDGRPVLEPRRRAVARDRLVGAHRLVLRLPDLAYGRLQVCASWDGTTTSRLMIWAIQSYLEQHEDEEGEEDEEDED